MCSSTDATAPCPSALSPVELDRELCRCFRLSARLKLRFIALLRHLEDSRLFRPLGFSDAVHYAECRFGYQRAETCEQLRVARLIDSLPLLKEAFAAGDLCWSGLKSLTRIARPETERRWLEFSRKKRVREIQGEVDAALEDHRELPRREGSGLPRVKVRFLCEYSPEELAVVQAALGKVSAEVAESLGGQLLKPGQALLYLAQRVLETDAVSCGERREGGTSPYTVVLQACPRCKEAAVPTEDGPVKVPQEVFERLVREAEVVDLEQELRSQRSVRRRVLLRDAHRCANPYCRQRSTCLHSHHVVWASEGGKTSVRNELAVCPACHTNLHAGFLRVMVDAAGRFHWTTALESGEDMARDIEAKLRSAAVPPICNADRDRPEAKPLDLRALEAGLVRLGYTRSEARQRLTLALERRRDARLEPSIEAVLKEALRA